METMDEEVRQLLNLAKGITKKKGKDKPSLEDIIEALLLDTNNIQILKLFLQSTDITKPFNVDQNKDTVSAVTISMEPDDKVKRIIKEAMDLSPDKQIHIPYLICILVQRDEAIRVLQSQRGFSGQINPLSFDDAKTTLEKYLKNRGFLANELDKIRVLQKELTSKIFGQDNAVLEIIEGLKNSIWKQIIIPNRIGPLALFIFVGPSGVGKTYSAQIIANALKRPFKEFDLSVYSDPGSHIELVGNSQWEGLLTQFARTNPNAIIAINDMEKTHMNTLKIFLSLLDSGELEDRRNNAFVSFKDIILIFTTNAGKLLYETKGQYKFNRNMILHGLETPEKEDDLISKIFPENIPHWLVSRLGKGYPILYHHLETKDMIKVINAIFDQFENDLKQTYPKIQTVDWDDKIPICLLFRESGDIDARQITAEAEKFVTEVRAKFNSQFGTTKKFEELTKLKFEFDTKCERPDELKQIDKPLGIPKMLLIANRTVSEEFKKYYGKEFEIYASEDLKQIENLISKFEFELILVDVWLDDDVLGSKLCIADGNISTPEYELDNIQLITDIMMSIKIRTRDIPTYILSFMPENETDSDVQKTIKSPFKYHRSVDEVVYLQCARNGNVHGIIQTSFDFKAEHDKLYNQFKEILEINRYEIVENKLNSEHHIIRFDLSLHHNDKNKELTILLTNFRTDSAIESNDIAQFVDDVQRPNVHFCDVIGVEDAVEELGDIVSWIKNPYEMRRYGFRDPKGVLLTGPPGTGKTLLARALAGESNKPFIAVSPSNIGEIFYGSGPKKIREIFDKARKYAPSVIFIDEIDAIGKKRVNSGSNNEDEKTLNALLVQMDGFQAPTAPPVIIIGATNREDILDPALIRRFDRIIKVGLPDRDARKKYLDKMISGISFSKITQDKIETVARSSVGMSLSDLERVLYEAKKRALKEFTKIRDAAVKAGNAPPTNPELTDDMFIEAFEGRAMGTKVKKYSDAEIDRIAVHEAGHALIAMLAGRIPEQITLVGRGDALGYVRQQIDEDKMILCKEDLILRIRECLAGRVAEIIVYGEMKGNSTGPSSDLEKASQIAISMVKNYAMVDSMKFIYSNSLEVLTPDMLLEINKSAAGILAKEFDETKKILDENKPLLLKLVAKLKQKDRLFSKDLENLMNGIEDNVPAKSETSPSSSKPSASEQETLVDNKAAPSPKTTKKKSSK